MPALCCAWGLTAALLALAPPAAQASVGTSAALPAVRAEQRIAGRAADTGSAAQAAAEAAAAYRARATTLMRGYQRSYGDRLTPAERARVATAIADGLASLAGVDRRAQRTADLAHAGAGSRRVNAARLAAINAHGQATAALQSALGELQPLLVAHLNLLEALRAKADLDQALQDLDALGLQLRAIPMDR